MSKIQGGSLMSKAIEILESSVVIDCHLDIGMDLETKHAKGRKNVLVEEYLPTFKAGYVDTVFAACFVDTKDLPEMGVRKLFDQISLIYQEVDESDGAFVIVRNTKEILEAKRNGQVGLLLAVEGVEPLNGDILLLRSLYELGVRVMSLCWSRSGWAADGCRFLPFGGYEGYGLTEDGEKFVQRAEELGILVDVSHCNLKSFWDVARIAKKPFIATHSDAYAVSPVARNLDDDQIRILSERKCIMGLNGGSLIVNYEYPQEASMNDLVKHLLHEKRVGSANILAIGLDQADRISDACFALIGKEIFDVIPTHDKFPEFVEMLIDNGFSDEEITGILGRNIMDLLLRTID